MIARYGGSFLMRIERRHETNGNLDGCTFVGDDSEVAKISNSAGHEMFMACLKKPSYVVALVISLIVSHATAQSGGKFNAQDFKTRSVFELMVDDSTVLRVGASKIVTQSASLRCRASVLRHPDVDQSWPSRVGGSTIAAPLLKWKRSPTCGNPADAPRARVLPGPQPIRVRRARRLASDWP